MQLTCLYNRRGLYLDANKIAGTMYKIKNEKSSFIHLTGKMLIAKAIPLFGTAISANYY